MCRARPVIYVSNEFMRLPFEMNSNENFHSASCRKKKRRGARIAFFASHRGAEAPSPPRPRGIARLETISRIRRKKEPRRRRLPLKLGRQTFGSGSRPRRDSIRGPRNCSVPRIANLFRRRCRVRLRTNRPPKVSESSATLLPFSPRENRAGDFA